MRPYIYLSFIAFSVLLAAACDGTTQNDPDPEVPESPARRLPGLAAFTTDMLKRGAGERSTEQIAEAIELVGGDLAVETERDYSVIYVRVLADHLELAMDLLADLSQRPTFPNLEMEKARLQELDRLQYMQSQPRWLANRELYKALYGPRHPYGEYDSNPEAIKALTRDDLVAFHAEHYVPRNAFLVVVGDADPTEVAQLAKSRFGGWQDRPAPAHEIPEAPVRDSREVLIVNRPGSTQSQIAFGNVSIARSDEDYVPLRVANLVLGGNASARLFMNLRERCGYGYGAYSSVTSLRSQAPFTASGAVESQHTAGALREIFAELDRMHAGAPQSDELDAAKSYMNGTFPMATETASGLARLITIQRVYGLPADYWSTYRSNIEAVTAEAAHDAAREHMHPSKGVLVIVGDAQQITESTRRYGNVTIIEASGEPMGVAAGMPDQWPGGVPPQCEDLPPTERTDRAQQPPAPGQPADLVLPVVREHSLDNGLEVLSIQRTQLPVVYLRLVVRSGSASDPL